LIDEPDDEHMLRPEFGRGLKALTAANLSYDLLITPRHSAAALAVVDAHPQLRFVLDHAGPARCARWWPDAFATGPGRTRAANVACKLSGLEFMADWQEWSAEDLRPYQEAVLQAFGPNRIMLGSNWPVFTIAGGYTRAIGASLTLIEGLTADERSAISRRPRASASSPCPPSESDRRVCACGRCWDGPGWDATCTRSEPFRRPPAGRASTCGASAESRSCSAP